MSKARKSSTKAQVLSFPNPSRSYDETRHGVRFWGYDKTFEISFFIKEDALAKVDPETRGNEAGYLNTFDVNRDRICEVAGNIYARREKTSYIFSYTLVGSDF